MAEAARELGDVPLGWRARIFAAYAHAYAYRFGRALAALARIGRALDSDCGPDALPAGDRRTLRKMLGHAEMFVANERARLAAADSQQVE